VSACARETSTRLAWAVRAVRHRSLLLAALGLAAGVAGRGVEAQANAVTVEAVRVGGGSANGHTTVPYLRARGSARGSAFGMPLEATASAWLNLDDVDSSVLNIEEVLITKEWHSAELRFGMGDVAWGLSELRSPVDMMVPRAVLWDVAGGPRLGQPLVSLTLFGGWGDLQAVALPFSRPVHLDGVITTETWDGLPIHSVDGWGADAVGGLRFSRIQGPLDLALSYVDGVDRSLWAVRDQVGGAVLDAPSLRQGAYEIQWALGSLVLRTEGALARRAGETELRLIAGGEWYPAPYLSFELMQGVVSAHREARGSLTDDLLIGAQLIGEDLRVRARLFVDPSSGNRHYFLKTTWRIGELTSLESEIAGWAGDATREPALAARQRSALLVSLVRYF